MTAPGDDPRSGLAAERTGLAWNRSGLSLLACGVVIARGVSVRGLSSGRAVLGVAVLGLGGAVWGLGGLQARRRSRHGRDRRRAVSADLLPVALGTAAVGMAAGVLALVPR